MLGRLFQAGVAHALTRFNQRTIATQSQRFITTSLPRQQISTPRSFAQFPQQTLQYSLAPRSSPVSQPKLFTQQLGQFHIKLKINTRKHARVNYKSRPHKASVKRFWQTGSGKIMRFRAGLNHKRRRKTKAQLRRLNQRVEVPQEAYRRLTKMMYLPNHLRLPQGQSRPCNKFWQPPKKASKVNKKRYC